MQNAVTARYKYDIPSLYPSQICCVFLTHLHSDHTMDYAELVFTLLWRRRQELSAWGPAGLQDMTNGALHGLDAGLSNSRIHCHHRVSPVGHVLQSCATEIVEGVVRPVIFLPELRPLTEPGVADNLVEQQINTT